MWMLYNNFLYFIVSHLCEYSEFFQKESLSKIEIWFYLFYDSYINRVFASFRWAIIVFSFLCQESQYLFKRTKKST